MTTVDALKALYVLLGGSADDVENITLIPDMIQAYEGLSSLTAVGDIQTNSSGGVTIDSPHGFIVNTEYDIEINTNSAVYISGGSDDNLNFFTGKDIRLEAGSGELILEGDDGIFLSTGAGSNIELTSSDEMNLTTDGGSLNLQATNNDINLSTTGNGDIYIKQGNAEQMTLENYIKQVAGIS